MEGVDIGILTALLAPALAGLLYGFLGIMFSFAAWLLAALMAMKLSGYFSPLLIPYFNPLLGSGIAFVVVFLIGLVLFSLLGRFIVRLLGRTGLTAADRFLGGVFGLSLGAAFVFALVFLAGFTALTEKDWWQDSLLIEPFQRLCVWGQRFLSEDMAAHHRYAPVAE